MLHSMGSQSQTLLSDWTTTTSFPVLHHSLGFASILVHWISDVISPSHPLPAPSPPALNLSQHQGLFQWVRWPKYWSFSFSISPSNEYSGVILILSSTRLTDTQFIFVAVGAFFPLNFNLGSFYCYNFKLTYFSFYNV